MTTEEKNTEFEDNANEALEDIEESSKLAEIKIKNSYDNIEKEIEKINLNSSPAKIKNVLIKHLETNNIIKNILVQNVDYGVIPGTQKNTLFQAGADKLKRAFGISTKFTLISKIFELEKGKEFIYFSYKCEAFFDGVYLDEAIASCNSNEPGKGGTNRNVIFQKINTIDQIAQKRAKVRVLRTILGITGLFTQDEDTLISTNGNKTSKEKQLGTYRTCYTMLNDAPQLSEMSKESIKLLFKKEILSVLVADNKIPNYWGNWSEEDCLNIVKQTEEYIK